MATVKRSYTAHPTMARFHQSRAFHRAVRGPRGSGKSTGCCIELFKKACEQAPSPDGKRYTRWAIVRDTYRELLDTTVKTWSYWFPEEHLGPLNKQSMIHHIKWRDIDAEFMFRALDRPKDIKKTLSMELTGAYINEAKTTPFGLISGLDDAIGRYPAKDTENGFNGPTWHGMILDTNSPDDDHWWFKLDEQFRNGDLDPDIWEFFTQPGGLIERDGKFIANPDAENIENLPPNYYLNRMIGKAKDHIRVYYCNQYGFVLEGKPVHPEYVDATHCAAQALDPVKGIPITIGIDFGLTPAASFGQRLANGRWIVINELVSTHMGIKNFSVELKALIHSEYPGFTFVIGGDPAGSQEAQTDERTCFQIMQANGFPQAEPAYHNNDPVIRREALDGPLTRMIDGKPGFIVSPRCKVLRKALAGGYCFKKKQISGSDQYHEKPDKNRYSHIAEACEYMCLKGGEGARLVESPPTQQVDDFEMKINIDHGSADHSLGWMI